MALMLPNSSVSGIREGTTVPSAKTSQVVFIAAESLDHSPKNLKAKFLLGFERAVSIVNDLPNHIVLNHLYFFIKKNVISVRT